MTDATGEQPKLDLQGVLEKYMRGEAVSHGPSEEHMRDVLTRYVDALNRNDPDVILNMYAEDAVIVDPVGASSIAGKAAIETFVKAGLSAMRKAELSVPIRTCPGHAAAMAFTIQMDFGDQEVVIDVVDVMRFNAQGKVVEMKAHWGVSDVHMLRGDMQDFLAKFMPDQEQSRSPTEAQMRASMQHYLDYINNKDVNAFLGQFADDMVGEDPVGTKPVIGLEELTRFIGQGMASRVKLNAPIRTSLGQSAAMAFTIHMELGGQEITIDTIDVMTFDAQGKIVDAKAYWGQENVTVLGKN